MDLPFGVHHSLLVGKVAKIALGIYTEFLISLQATVSCREQLNTILAPASANARAIAGPIP